MSGRPSVSLRGPWVRCGRSDKHKSTEQRQRLRLVAESGESTPEYAGKITLITNQEITISAGQSTERYIRQQRTLDRAETRESAERAPRVCF